MDPLERRLRDAEKRQKAQSVRLAYLNGLRGKPLRESAAEAEKRAHAMGRLREQRSTERL